MPDQNLSASSPVGEPQTPPVGTSADDIAPPIEPTGSVASPPNIPPVIQSTKSSGINKKAVTTLLGLLVLVGGIGAGVVLVKQRQQTQSQAYIRAPGVTDLCGIRLTVNEDTPCLGNETQNPKNNISTFKTTYLFTNMTSDSRDFHFSTGSYYCTEPLGQGGLCLSNPILEDKYYNLNPGETVEVPVERTSTSGQACGSFQTDVYNLAVGDYAGCKTTVPAATICLTGNTCTSPSPSPSGQCLSVKAYDASWQLLSATDLSALHAGDVVRFTIAGQTTEGTFDKARFTINGTLRPEVVQTRPGSAPQEFYDEYTIPAGVTSFTVNAEVHHSILGWF